MSTPALCQLDDMLHLKPNWDSYGAKQIDIDCIRAAKEILRPLNGRWQAVPMSNGGVQLEKHSDGIDIEITICRATLETKTEHKCVTLVSIAGGPPQCVDCHQYQE
jgi:hypothetical protein